MIEQAFTFEKLDITSKDWDIIYADNQCGYKFSTPSDGILVLKSAGKIRPGVLRKQINFIENYHIQLNRRLVNYKSVLVWDVSELYSLKYLNIIIKELGNLSVDVLIIVPGKLFFQLLLSYWKRKTGFVINLLISNLDEAIAFARRIKTAPDATDSFKGQFADFWSATKKTKKIGKHIYRYLELPVWQYESDDKTFKSKVAFFENKTILYEMDGRLSAVDVQSLQQRVVTIGNQLELDLSKFAFYVIFDTRKVTYIEPEARKLLRKMEQHQHHLSGGVVMLVNSMIKYFFNFRKRLHPERYTHWSIGKSLQDAFSIIELNSTLYSGNIFKNKRVIEPAKDYEELKRQFQELQSEYNILKNSYVKSLSNIRKILSFVDAGDFLSTPFKPRYDDDSIEGEVYNSFAVLNKDLNKNRSFSMPHNFEIGLTYSNIETILNAVSNPALIYSNKKILFVNKAFAELTGCNITDFKGQPLGSFVHTYELNRVERYLEEMGSNNIFECDIYNEQDRTITITMSSEFMLIDGIYSQMIFVGSKTRSVKDSSYRFTGQKGVEAYQVSESTTNKGLAGVNNFYHLMLKSVNQKLFNQYISPESFNPQVGSRILDHVSGYIRRVFESVANYQANPDRVKMFMLKESIDAAVIIFNDYLNITRPDVKFKLVGNVSSQKIALPLHSFWVEVILIRILHLMCDATEGETIELNCKHTNDQDIEITISDDGSNLNLFSLDRVKESGKSAMSIMEIDQLLKHFNCKFYLESTLERGNRMILTFPIIDRGIGYDGSLMDLSFHNILVYDEAREFESYNVALMNTGANLIHSNNLQDALNALLDNKISVIFLNMGFSEIDISLFVSRVKNEHKVIPIIGLTKDTSHKSWKKNIQSGVDVFLSKPIDARELKENIKLYLT